MKAESIIKPKRPKGRGWTPLPPPPQWHNHGYPAEVWRPVAEKHIGLECPCKAEEPVMREDKGDFEWRGITK